MALTISESLRSGRSIVPFDCTGTSIIGVLEVVEISSARVASSGSSAIGDGGLTWDLLGPAREGRGGGTAKAGDERPATCIRSGSLPFEARECSGTLGVDWRKAGVFSRGSLDTFLEEL